MASESVLDLRTLSFGPLVCGLLVFLQAVLVALGTENPRFSDFHFLVEPSKTIAVRGEAALLNCSVEHGTQSVQVSWLRDGIQMNFDGDSRRRILSNGSLYFSTIEHTRSHRPDEAVFQCVAEVTLGTIVSRKAQLQVAYLSKSFAEEPQDLSVFLGDTAMFKCIMEGAPKPEVRWFKDDSDITNSDSSSYHIEDGVLEIISVDSSHFGRYKCEVSNVDRSRTSRTAYLSRKQGPSGTSVAPSFIMQPNSQTTTEGSTIQMFCEANGKDLENQQPTITWLKDGSTIDLTAENGRFSIVGKSSLQIEGVLESDTGSYTCRATNLEDSVDAVATITVHVPPRFVKEPRNIFAHENADVEFECEVYGNPQPTVQWMKNGDLVFPSDYFQIIDGHNLRILGLVNSDQGIYQCTAENDVGNIQAGAQLLILRQGVPLPTMPLFTTPHNHHTGNSGRASPDLPSSPTNLRTAVVSTRFVTLSWSAPTNPGSSEVSTYSVFWKERGSVRERVLNTTNLEANIQHLKAGTSYEFRVVAYNNAGPSQQPGRVTVQTQVEANVPGPATNVEVKAISPSAIKASWSSPADSSGDITHYQLFYYEEGEEEEHDVRVNGHQHVLTGLKKFHQYSFRVVAHNANGAGVSTDEVMATTYSDAPSDYPQNVTVETTNSNSVVIRWDPPPEDHCNGIITGYKIRCKKRRVDDGSIITTDGNRRHYALTDLEKGTDYQIRIQAMTVNGSGPATEWILVKTPQHDLSETHVPDAPWGLQVRPFADSIIVSWNPPKNKQILVRGYTLGYGMNIPDIYQKVLDAKERIFTIKNLRPAAQYVIRLRAFNNMGEGQSVYENVFTRELSTPQQRRAMTPPVGLHAQVLSSSSVLLTWSDHDLGRNQRIRDNRFYSIRCQPRGARKFKVVNSTDLNVHIDELKPSTDYEFSVKVIKGKRESTWSLSVFNRTFEDSPTTAPRDLTPVPVEGKPTSVTLNWQPPRQANGRITGYVVLYTTDNTQPDSRWVVDAVPGDRLSYTVRDLSPETTYFFKIQASNSKGNGPMSPTVIFRTPAPDGTGGGMIETPNDWGRTIDDPRYNGGADPGYNGGTVPGYNGPGVDQTGPQYTNNNSGQSQQDDKKKKKESKKGGIPPLILWVSISLVSVFAVIGVIVITVIMCKRRVADSERKKRNKGGYHPANKGGPTNLKPPDLWIHHEQMELKSMGEKPGPETVGLVHNSSPDLAKSLDDVHSGTEMDKRRNSFISERKDQDERYHRNPHRPKPIMIPVDQPPPPREPIATATALPNGHLNQEKMVTVVAPTPIRPIYPRTQYPGHYTSTPRVNAGDISQPSSGPQSPVSPCSHPQLSPVPYEKVQHHHASTPTGGNHHHNQQQQQMMQGTQPLDGTKSLPHRSPHPLKSFSVPAPPPGTSAPNTPVPKHNIVKPQPQGQQQQQGQNPPPSPYKKPPPPAGVSPGKARSPMPVVSPRAPDVTLRSNQSDNSDLPKSFSTEELTAEMENLEGLMKDLNAITQQEFEC